MNLRELMTSTPYTRVHAPRRSYVAYSTRKCSGTEVERVANISLCDHPSLARLRALAHLATIPLPVYNREGARTVKKDDYALHYDDGHVLAVTITGPSSSNGTRNAEATRGLAYDALILDVTTQKLHPHHDGSYTWANMPPTVRLHYKDLGRCVLVCSRSAWSRCRGQLQVLRHWWVAAWFAFHRGLRCPTLCRPGLCPLRARLWSPGHSRRP